MTKFILLMTMAFSLSGCLDRLNNVGRAPAFTEMDAGVTADISPQRAAMAAQQPVARREFYEQGSLWRSGPTSLFGDRRAARLGDILTVIIDINDKAQLQNSTTRARSAGENVAIAELLGLPHLLESEFFGEGNLDPAVQLNSSSSTDGSGTVRRNETIMLRIAATVVEVLPNGHLVVRGTQEVRVNYELRDLQVAGIIRPEDISRQNTISYDKMAGARILYGGRGQISDVQQPRYGQQIFEIIAPF
ncbi:MAG: flagellar basal body L-ring protein FlgH [Rhodobacteraceae bacterium]|nr:flagellar basal body L-ring protein FlgH [Paracoccaceae bacterium]